MAKTYYVTRDAPTKGILIFKDAACKIYKSQHLCVKSGHRFFIGRKDWFTDPAQAQLRARELVEAKIVSLNKQKQKLEALLAKGVPCVEGKDD